MPFCFLRDETGGEPNNTGFRAPVSLKFQGRKLFHVLSGF